MLGMCTFGWMVGWIGAMPKSSHHRGLARCQVKGEKMVRWCPGNKILQAHHVAMGGGGIHKVSGGVHRDVGVLGLPHRVSMHGIQQLATGGGLRGQMQKLKGGESEAELSPQICGQELPPQDKSCTRGCGGQCELCQGRGQGMLPSPLHHPPPAPVTGRSPPPFGGGRRGGLGTVLGCRQQDRGGTARKRPAIKRAGTWSQKAVKKGFESV